MNIGLLFSSLVVSIYIIGLIYNGLFNSHQNLTYLTTEFIIFLLIIFTLIHLCIKNYKSNIGFYLLLLTFLIIILIYHILQYKDNFELIEQNKNKNTTITINQI